MVDFRPGANFPFQQFDRYGNGTLTRNVTLHPGGGLGLATFANPDVLSLAGAKMARFGEAHKHEHDHESHEHDHPPEAQPPQEKAQEKPIKAYAWPLQPFVFVYRLVRGLADSFVKDMKLLMDTAADRVHFHDFRKGDKTHKHDGDEHNHHDHDGQDDHEHHDH